MLRSGIAALVRDTLNARRYRRALERIRNEPFSYYEYALVADAALNGGRFVASPYRPYDSYVERSDV